MTDPTRGSVPGVLAPVPSAELCRVRQSGECPYGARTGDRGDVRTRRITERSVIAARQAFDRAAATSLRASTSWSSAPDAIACRCAAGSQNPGEFAFSRCHQQCDGSAVCRSYALAPTRRCRSAAPMPTTYSRRAQCQGSPRPANAPRPPTTAADSACTNSGTTTRGQTGRWQTATPAGLELVGATAIQLVSTGRERWRRLRRRLLLGRRRDRRPTTRRRAPWRMVFSSPSSYFGMQLVCGRGTCTQPALLAVRAFSLYVRETSGPSFSAPSWTLADDRVDQGHMALRCVWGNSPSGLCSLSASLNGQLINTTTSAQDVSTWHQCAAPAISQSVDTSSVWPGRVAADA